MPEELPPLMGKGLSGVVLNPEPAERPSAVGDEAEWRRRAVRAEAEVKALSERLARAEEELGVARLQAESARRGRLIDQALLEADALDLEAARALVEVSRDEDVPRAVADLKRRKPFLFQPAPGASRASAMGGVMGRGAVEDGSALAEAARQSGDRRLLYRYLRARRGQG